MNTSLLALPAGLLVGEFLTILFAYLIAETATGERSRIAMATTLSDVTLFVAAALLFEGVVRNEGPVGSIDRSWVFPVIAVAYAIAGVGIYFGHSIERHVGDTPAAAAGRRQVAAYVRREILGLRRALVLVGFSVLYLFAAVFLGGVLKFP